MIKEIKNYICLGIFLGVVSCQDSFNDEEASRIVTMAPFRHLELHSAFEVYLLQGTSSNITVIGDSEVIKHIAFKIKDGVLAITNENKRKWLNPGLSRVKLYINSSLLYRMDLYETCYIKSVDPIIAEDFAIINQPTPRLCEIDIELDNAYFFYWNNYQCGGRVNLRGKTGLLEAHTFALMTMDASQLITDEAFIENGSKGDCEVNVKNKLEYSIHDTGNIYLHGSPSEIILNEHTSTGALIRLN